MHSNLTNDYIQESFMNEISEFRVSMHKCLYNDPDCINTLDNIIKNHLEVLSVEFDQAQKYFVIKIKKTSMKKNQNFAHSTNYYYNIFNNIFSEFISTYSNRINQERKGLGNYMLSNVVSLGTTNLLYGLTVLSDNIIILYL